MNKDYALIIIEWIIMTILLIIFIPRNKLRLAQVSFLFKLLITWLAGLAVVELRLIEYPVRLFSYANRTSFTFEYFVYPSICAIFNVHYPEKKCAFGQFMHYFYYCSIITIIEGLAERYTNIIRYIHWTWYVTWITLFVTFYITHKYCLWFFKSKKPN